MRVTASCLSVSLMIVLLLSACSAAASSRRDTVLQLDDGITGPPLHWYDAWTWGGVAAGFEAPSWARSLISIRFFVKVSEGEPRTAGAYVWEYRSGPGSQVAPPQEFVVETPVGAWVDVLLQEPVNLEDAQSFPNRRFFVGLLWSGASGSVALDSTEEEPYETFVHEGSWLLFPWGDAFIRAVVSDEWSSPVEPSSWTKVKALYQNPRHSHR